MPHVQIEREKLFEKAVFSSSSSSSLRSLLSVDVSSSSNRSIEVERNYLATNYTIIDKHLNNLNNDNS